MAFFNLSEPVLRRKQTDLDMQDLCGLLKVRLQLGSLRLLSVAYTRVDQAILLWGIDCVCDFWGRSVYLVGLDDAGLSVVGADYIGDDRDDWVDPVLGASGAVDLGGIRLGLSDVVGDGTDGYGYFCPLDVGPDAPMSDVVRIERRGLLADSGGGAIAHVTSAQCGSPSGHYLSLARPDVAIFADGTIDG